MFARIRNLGSLLALFFFPLDLTYDCDLNLVVFFFFKDGDVISKKEDKRHKLQRYNILSKNEEAKKIKFKFDKTDARSLNMGRDVSNFIPGSTNMKN